MKPQTFSSTHKFALLVAAILFFGGVVFFLHHTQATSSNIAARDATRISDLSQIQNDLQLYYNKCGYYPGVAQPGNSCGAYIAVFTWAGLTTALTGSNLGITNVPGDPTTGEHYSYGAKGGGTGYVLAATLEDPASPALAQSAKGFVSGVMCTGSVYCVKL